MGESGTPFFFNLSQVKRMVVISSFNWIGSNLHKRLWPGIGIQYEYFLMADVPKAKSLQQTEVKNNQ